MGNSYSKVSTIDVNADEEEEESDIEDEKERNSSDAQQFEDKLDEETISLGYFEQDERFSEMFYDDTYYENEEETKSSQSTNNFELITYLKPFMREKKQFFLCFHDKNEREEFVANMNANLDQRGLTKIQLDTADTEFVRLKFVCLVILYFIIRDELHSFYCVK